MLWSGEYVWRRGSRAASSEAETSSGVRVSLVRRRLARGDVDLSSEAEIRLRGCQALERSGYSPEGASSPRAKRRFARGGVKPSIEAEISWRGAWCWGIQENTSPSKR
jgi:hypothetical protein